MSTQDFLQDLRTSVNVGILIGGASRRMGSPKQLLSFDGNTLLEKTVATIINRVQNITLVGDGELPLSLAGLKRIPDVSGINGPLAGMLAAMRSDTNVAWIFLACDLPLLRGDAIDWLRSQRTQENAAILPTLKPGCIEPLLALYEPIARVLLEELAASRTWSLQSLSQKPSVSTPQPPPELRDCWTNVNTPNELQALTTDRRP